MDHPNHFTIAYTVHLQKRTPKINTIIDEFNYTSKLSLKLI